MIAALRSLSARVRFLCLGVVALLWREVDFGDVVLVGGLVALWYGLGCWSIPLAWTCVGALLVKLAWPKPLAEAPPRRRRRGD